ncbi:MAG: baseplate J/gp47 family protein [Bacteroidia bacterium]
MANPNPIPHPFLLKPGTRQGDRQLMALNPDHIKIDDRKLGELLVYLHEFASQINFYDLQLGLHDWQRFFATSLPFQLARLQHLALSEQSASITTAIELVRTEPRKEHLVPVFQEIYQDHFAFLHQLSLRLNAANHSFAPILDRLIASNLQEPLKQYIAHSNCLSDQGLEVGVDLNPLLDSDIWGLEFIDLYSRPADCFNDATQTVTDILKMVSALEDIQSVSESVLGQTQNQLLAIDGYLQESLIPLQEAQRQKHDPQLGLLFTFLELFAQFQGHLNQLSRAHLDYFFKTVLGIKTRSAKPDEAIVVFELQQHIDQYKLDKGRLVQDATDANDADIVFSLDDEIVLDKAKAVAFRALHVNQIVSGEERLVEGVYVAPDITKADGKEEDFKGDGPHSWPTLGGKVSKFLPPVDPETETASFQDYDRAQQGFVLASSALFLQEGERTISFSFVSEKLSQESLAFLQELFALNNDGTFVKKTLSHDGLPLNRWADSTGLESRHALPEIVPGTYYKVNFDPSIPEARLAAASLPFSIMLSGAESWLELLPEHFKAFDLGFCELGSTGVQDRFCMLLTVELPPEFPAITFADPEVLVDDFQTHLPLAKIELRPDFKIVCLPSNADAEACCLDNRVDPNAAEVSFYHYLRDLTFCKTDINVKVCGVRNIVVQNDENLQDINSLVYPFGVRPTVSEVPIISQNNANGNDLLGSNFFIGSKEVFCKNWKRLQMNVNWKDLPEDFKMVNADNSYHYYSGYEDFTVRPRFEGVKYENFRFQASVLESGVWKKESNKRQLFVSGVGGEPITICDHGNDFEQNFFFAHSAFNQARDISKPLPLEPIEELTVNSRDAFLRFTLKDQDFQHRRYPFILARQMMAFGKFQDDEKLVYSAVYGFQDPADAENIITFVNGGTTGAPANFGQGSAPSFSEVKKSLERISLASAQLQIKVGELKTLIQGEQDDSNAIPTPPDPVPVDGDGNSLLNTRQQLQYDLAAGLTDEIAGLIAGSSDIVDALAEAVGDFVAAEFFTAGGPPQSKIQSIILGKIKLVLESSSAQNEIKAFAGEVVNEVANYLKQTASPDDIFIAIKAKLEGYVKTFYQVTHDQDLAAAIATELKNNALTSTELSAIAQADLANTISNRLQSLNVAYIGTNNANNLISQISSILTNGTGSNDVTTKLKNYVYDELRALFALNTSAAFTQVLSDSAFSIASDVADAVKTCVQTASSDSDLTTAIESAIENSIDVGELLSKVGEIITDTIGANADLLIINTAFEELTIKSPNNCDATALIGGNSPLDALRKTQAETAYDNLRSKLNGPSINFLEEVEDSEKKTFNIIENNVTSLSNAFELSLRCFSICDLSKMMDVLIQAALAVLPGNIDEFVIIPNEPYTPIIKDLSLDYTAVATSEKGEIDLMQLMPFAQSWQNAPLPAVECGNTDTSLSYPTLLASFHDEGTLFIGVQNLTPGSILNLYFQMAEATADSEYDRAEIQWAYIKDNQWQALRDQFQVLEDGTQGFTRSGIVKIAVPGDISPENVTLLPPTEEPLYWFKASAERNTAAICETIAVYTQAVKTTASLQPNNDANRLAEPLPKESLDKLAQADSAINIVVQPAASKGGAPPEEDDANNYYTRVSERLRHKGRGVNAFDYERIVLEAFPSIYTVKCITHSKSLPGSAYRQDLHLAPGFVSLALIPDLNVLKSANSATPKASISLLNEIKDHLQSRISPFVQLKVVNPRYEAVDVDVDVQFHAGLNASFYLKELAREIRLHLTPWLNGDQSKLCFAHGASQSDLVSFVESRPYIDFISCVKMTHEDDPADPECASAYLDIEGQVSPRSARSILLAGTITTRQFAEIYCECYQPNNNYQPQ